MSNTMELLTGFTGEAHIDSGEQGLLQADIVGRDRYITQAGTRLAITMIDNNTVEIGTGAIFNQGRYIINKSPVQLTLENGSQTLDRNVLICAEYSKNPSTLIEDANWQVLHGEPSSAPTDPEVTEGNIFAGAVTDMMKVYRIPFSKLTPRDPVLLVDTLTSLMDLKGEWDSISHSEWKDLPLASGFRAYDTVGEGQYSPRCIKRGNLVQAVGAVSPKAAYTSSSTEKVFGILPEGLRPTQPIHVIAVGSGMRSWRLQIDTDGSMSESRYGTGGAYDTVATTSYLGFNVMFFVP